MPLVSPPSLDPFRMPKRVLMGPGPSDVDPRVLKALATPLVGHLDPEFVTLMDETQNLLRYVFQTENQLTLAISGTGSAGMETVVVNLHRAGRPDVGMYQRRLRRPNEGRRRARRRDRLDNRAAVWRSLRSR